MGRSSSSSTTITAVKDEEEKRKNQPHPNVLVIMTDEHNLRTLGCYRELMSQDQAYTWGLDVHVDTPFIDSIAKRGALFTNFYSVSPTCTPSRGSFLTGMYPNRHGAQENDTPMRKSSITFAQILKERLDYHTGYIGKFHLHGKDRKPNSFGAPNGRSFGFDDTRYQWNRGHWKYMTEDASHKVQGYSYHDANEFVNKTGVYTTEFLVDRALDFIEDHIQRKSNDPFALMLSLPDPHGPNYVHAPYSEMYKDLMFQVPRSAVVAMRKNPALPLWSKLWTKVMDAGVVPQRLMEDHLEKMYTDQERMDFYRPILGMVKAIDDNVGRILKKLSDAKLDEDTVIVFTADHGDMMGEHGRDEKQTPYKTSAGVPFIISYPKTVKPGKIVETPYSAVDFVPTLLNLLNLDLTTNYYSFDGIDFSRDLTSPDMIVADEDALIFTADTWAGTWAACATSKYKLVLSNSDIPWLFDLEQDPDEIANYFGHEDYLYIYEYLKVHLLHAMEKYEFPLWHKTVLLDRPTYWETDDLHDFSFYSKASCNDISSLKNLNDACNEPSVRTICPITCKNFEEDSIGQILHNATLIECKDVAKDPTEVCNDNLVNLFCIRTCIGDVTVA